MKKHFIIITLFSLQNIISFAQGSERWKAIFFNATAFKVQYDKYKIPTDIISALFESITDVANPKEKVNGKPLQLKWFAVDKYENYVVFVTLYGSSTRNICYLFSRKSIDEDLVIGDLVMKEIQGDLNFKDFKTFFLKQDIKVNVHQLKSRIDSASSRYDLSKNVLPPSFSSHRPDNGYSSNSKTDSIVIISIHPFNDLLPPEFNSPALENEYYYSYTDYAPHISVLRLRNNQAFVYETYHKLDRIDYRIGNYCISGDTIYLRYQTLLKGKPEYSYADPMTMVSWCPPRRPDYLLLNSDKLYDRVGERCFNYLTDKPEFNLEGTK